MNPLEVYYWLHSKDIDWVAIWTFGQVVVVGLASFIALRQLSSYNKTEGFKQANELVTKYSHELGRTLFDLERDNLDASDTIKVKHVLAMAKIVQFFSYAENLYYSGIIHRPTYLYNLAHETVDAWYHTKPFRDRWGIGVKSSQFQRLAKECYTYIKPTVDVAEYPGLSFDYVPYEEQEFVTTDLVLDDADGRVIIRQRLKGESADCQANETVPD